ncbi:MAG: cytochrome b/b6 domain-containing protein [Steroidobacteraceae bacterium]
MEPSQVKVWDPLVRIAHWLLALTVLIAWLTRHSPGRWHEWIGYGSLVLVGVRLIWGFLGSRHARFSEFVRSPTETLGYSLKLVAGQESRHVGHNPLGGWMIVALLLNVVLVSLTGWLYTTDRFWGVAWLDALHSALADGLIVLVALHLAGVVYSSVRHRENLIAAMFHGRKRA